MAEVLRAIIGTYRDVLKAPALTDAALFSNYALAALVVDEVCREVGGLAGPGGRWGAVGCWRQRSRHSCLHVSGAARAAAGRLLHVAIQWTPKVAQPSNAAACVVPGPAGAGGAD